MIFFSFLLNVLEISFSFSFWLEIFSLLKLFFKLFSFWSSFSSIASCFSINCFESWSNDFVLFDYGSLLDVTYSKYSSDGDNAKQIIKNGLYGIGWAVFQFKTYWFAVTFIIGFGGGDFNNWKEGTMWYSKKRHGTLDGKLYAGNKVIVIEELEGKIWRLIKHCHLYFY